MIDRETFRDGLAAGSLAAVVSGAPSTLYAMLAEGSPLEPSLAAGTLVLPREQRAQPPAARCRAGPCRPFARVGDRACCRPAEEADGRARRAGGPRDRCARPRVDRPPVSPHPGAAPATAGCRPRGLWRDGGRGGLPAPAPACELTSMSATMRTRTPRRWLSRGSTSASTLADDARAWSTRKPPLRQGHACDS